MEPTSSSTEEAINEAALSETPIRSQASASAYNLILVFFSLEVWVLLISQKMMMKILHFHLNY